MARSIFGCEEGHPYLDKRRPTPPHLTLTALPLASPSNGLASSTPVMDMHVEDSVNNSSADRSASWTSPGAGITGGYNGKDQTFQAVIVFICALAMYNAAELVIIILLTFRRYRGLYFWSLLLSSVGIFPYAIGSMLKFGNHGTDNLRRVAIALLTVGFYLVVTGQSVVLWSRLHLVVSGKKGDRILRWTKCMIIMDVVILQVPTTVLTFGANGDWDTSMFEIGYNIMEKIQMAGFFIQEVILSTIYIVATVQTLRQSLQPRTRVIMKQLIAINVVIIVMDMGLLALECASLYILEVLLKGVLYSIKLKLEFAILGKLVNVIITSKASRQPFRQTCVGFVTPGVDGTMDISEFVDLSRVHTDITNPSRKSESSATSKRPRGRIRASDFDYDMARFEHVAHLTTMNHIDSPALEHSFREKDVCGPRDECRDGFV